MPPESKRKRGKDTRQNTNRLQNSGTINKNIPSGQKAPKRTLGHDSKATGPGEPPEKIEKNSQRRPLLFEGIAGAYIKKKRHRQLLLVPQAGQIQKSIHRLQQSTITTDTA